MDDLDCPLKEILSLVLSLKYGYNRHLLKSFMSTMEIYIYCLATGLIKICQ